VNWFRKDGNGEVLWPGFGENMRVLKWIVDRCHGRAEADERPLGWMPDVDHLDVTGISGFTKDRMEKLQAVNRDEWQRELLSQEELLMKLYPSVPKELVFQRELLVSRL
jgi:phosphoenolpyruvate carboxykinase (GTP)